VDYFGYIFYWNILSALLTLIPLLSILFLPYPMISFFMFGIGLISRMALTYPILDLIVVKNVHGKAFALIKCFAEIIGFIIMFVNGYIAETAGYLLVIIINIILGIFATIFAFFAAFEFNRLEKENPKYLDFIKSVNVGS